MRSIWAGAISFGMVVIPVKLYAATEQRDVAFRQVHAEDGGRVQYRRFCSLDGQEVAYSDVAKGYELATGDVLFFCTDGLTDARSPDQAYFEGSLSDGLSTLAGKPPADIVSGMRRLVLDFCAGVLLDDLTMLILRVGEPPGP